MKNDLGEEINLAQRMPEKVKQLDARLTAAVNSMGAGLPKPNPQFVVP